MKCLLNSTADRDFPPFASDKTEVIKACMTLPADNEMIQQLDIDRLQCITDGCRHVNILF